MTSETRLNKLEKALGKGEPESFIAWVDNGIVTVNGEPMTEEEYNRRFPGEHKVVRVGVRLSEI